MGNLNREEFDNAIKGKTIEDFVQKVKELPVYDIYEKAAKDKEKDKTARLLQMSVMIFSMADSELSAMMTSVALDLLFETVDQRLRNEILNESE